LARIKALETTVRQQEELIRQASARDSRIPQVEDSAREANELRATLAVAEARISQLEAQAARVASLEERIIELQSRALTPSVEPPSRDEQAQNTAFKEDSGPRGASSEQPHAERADSEDARLKDNGQGSHDEATKSQTPNNPQDQADPAVEARQDGNQPEDDPEDNEQLNDDPEDDAAPDAPPTGEASSSPGRLPSGHQDNLRKIHGIGRAFERTLQAAGVRTYEQIAAWSPQDIEQYANLLKLSPQRIEGEGWVLRAQELVRRRMKDVAESKGAET
jgi:predicted flap endonuclease-1-like 5' DNA nuclease